MAIAVSVPKRVSSLLSVNRLDSLFNSPISNHTPNANSRMLTTGFFMTDFKLVATE